MTSHELDSLIEAWLHKKVMTWDASSGGTRADAFIERARYHGVTALLYAHLPHPANRPHGIIDALRAEALAGAMWELSHQQVLGRLIAALAEENITPLLFKGTALAYDLYPKPEWRSRGDTDLLLAPDDLVRCRDVLLAQGFSRVHAIPGEVISAEESWTLLGPNGSAHVLDVHRKINSSQVLSRLFTYDELRAAARPLPSLAPNAMAVSHIHALLIALMHRRVHDTSPYYTDGVAHYGGDRLIWLYDIHLLSQALTEREWHDVVAMAGAKGLAGICREGLERTRAGFTTPVPPWVLTGLAAAGPRETPTLYLEAGRLRQEWMNFSALDGVSNKAAYLKEHVFPPRSYMRWKYPDAAAASLAALYLRRALGGLAKRLRFRVHFRGSRS